ncbi:MAG: hypothetical protein U0802_22275 [Candidatus Binatia bacterium]
MILGLIGVPPDGIGIILGVDRLLDMCHYRQRHRRSRRRGGGVARRGPSRIRGGFPALTSPGGPLSAPSAG